MKVPPMMLRTESGFVCFGQLEHEGSKFGFGVDLFEGWGPVEVEDRDRSRLGDGDYSLPARRRPRFVTVAGEALAASWGELRMMRDTLGRLPESGDTITVTELGETMRTEGGVKGKPIFDIDYSTGRPRALWEITFKCPAPFKYGCSREWVARPGESVTVETRGSVPARPTAVVHGPIAAGWSLLGFRVDRAVAAGESVTVDTRTGSVRSSLSGELMGAVTGYPEQLPVGVATVEFHASGTGSAVVTATDTYV